MEMMLNGLTRWMVVLALMLAYWPFGHRAHALEPAATAAAAQANWRAPAIEGFEHALYSARLEWRGGRYAFAIATRATRDADQSRFVAMISQNGKAVAHCERKVLGEAPFDTNSMLLRCEGPLFSPAAATLKFVFGPSMNEPTLVFWTAPRAAGETIALRTDGAPVNVAKAE
jgi:hypothetical protein